jgi:GntR family transcriptional repressor for pyruvate dehydrogenase complex
MQMSCLGGEVGIPFARAGLGVNVAMESISVKERTMDMLLKPIKPKRLSDQIFEQLRDSIYRGQMQPGEKLPPERELAAAFNVSRPSLKAAMDKLIHIGLIEQRQGQGTFVRSMESRYDQNPLRMVLEGEEVTLVDLLEMRLGLEVQAASMAARRATDQDIHALKMCVQDMLSKVKEGEVGSDEDVAFHMTIAYATKNPAQIYLMRSFYDLLFQGINESRFYLSEAGNLEQMGQQHRSILQCIQDRDPVAAQERMREHITYVIDFCKKR